MRTWLLLLFCLAVLVAVVQAGRNDNEKDGNGNGPKKVVKKTGSGNNNNGPNNGNQKSRNSGKGGGNSNGPKNGNQDPKNGPKKLVIKGTDNVAARKITKKCKGVCITGPCNGEDKGKADCGQGETCCKIQPKKGGTGPKRFCKPLAKCNKLKGECRKKKTGCKLDEKRYKNKKNKKYCDKNSCYCCVKQCATKKKCSREGGSCMLKKEAKKDCDGSFIVNSKYCKGKKCGCCLPDSPAACAQTTRCEYDGGQCLAKDAKCEDGTMENKNANGKKYCKGKCQCCVPEIGSVQYGNYNLRSVKVLLIALMINKEQ